MKRSCSVSMVKCKGCVQVKGGIGTAAVGLWPHRTILRSRSQGWHGRRVARVAGRQNVATPAGSLVDEKMTGSPFESENRHSHHNIGLELSPSL